MVKSFPYKTSSSKNCLELLTSLLGQPATVEKAERKNTAGNPENNTYRPSPLPNPKDDRY